MATKINISTNLKHVYIDSFVDFHQKNKKYEPLHVLGAQFEALKQLFKEKIAQFGGSNRASADISTRCGSRRSPCRPAAPAKC